MRLAPPSSGHRRGVNALLTDNRAIAGMFMVLLLVNAYLIANGYYG